MTTLYQLSDRETVIAEDVLASNGGVIKRRGPLALRQNVDNGFPLMRQHVAGSGMHRPAMSIGDYPEGLWVQGIGQEADGYGSQDSGSGTYINLGRDREGVWVTQSWWIAIKAQSADALGTISFFLDTEAWGSARRSYFTAVLDTATGQLSIRDNAGTYPVVATLSPSGWNDNKYDRHYVSFTNYVGPSSATGTDFGKYGAFQFGGKVVDLRGLGGSANYDPSPIAQPGSSFSGGMNPGIGVTNPVAGKRGGVCVFDFALTIGDVL